MRLPVRLYLTRSIWLKLHLYLALSVGFIFALIGVTGSLLIYSDELDELLNPQLVIEASQQAILPPDTLLAAVRAAHPNRNGVWTLEMPRTPHSPVTFWFDKPAESTDALYAPLMVAVHPYSGQVLSSRLWGQTFVTLINDLHTELMLEATGRKAMAELALCLMLSVGSGLYLWWPGFAQLRKAFLPIHDQGLMRFVFDVHKLIGFFTAIFLLLMAFTGFHLAYPPLLEYLTASAGMGHGDAGPNVRSSAVPNTRPIKLIEAVFIARGPFPSSEVRRISTPRGETGTYRINIKQKNEINQHHPMTNVWIDRWSGQIRDVQNPSEFSSGQKFTTWMWPLHTGEAFAGTGRLLWFFGGFSPLFLYVTGCAHWLYKRGTLQDRPLDLPGLWAKLLIYLTMLARESLKLSKVLLLKIQHYLDSRRH